MIQVEHLTKRYGTFIANSDSSLTMASRALTVLPGPNKAGKSPP